MYSIVLKPALGSSFLMNALALDGAVTEYSSASGRLASNEKEKLEQLKKTLSKSKDKSNFEKSKKISEEISKLASQQVRAQDKLNELLFILPNLALDDVPIGKDEKSNKLINQFGVIKKFSFKPF